MTRPIDYLTWIPIKEILLHFMWHKHNHRYKKKTRILASGKFYLLIIHTFIHQLVWVSVN